jgi:hypothetical protein
VLAQLKTEKSLPEAASRHDAVDGTSLEVQVAVVVLPLATFVAKEYSQLASNQRRSELAKDGLAGH